MDFEMNVAYFSFANAVPNTTQHMVASGLLQTREEATNIDMDNKDAQFCSSVDTNEVQGCSQLLTRGLETKDFELNIA
jgi:hypothetical protein